MDDFKVEYLKSTDCAIRGKYIIMPNGEALLGEQAPAQITWHSWSHGRPPETVWTVVVRYVSEYLTRTYNYRTEEQAKATHDAIVTAFVTVANNVLPEDSQ